MIKIQISWIPTTIVCALLAGSLLTRINGNTPLSIFLLGTALGTTLLTAYINRKIKEDRSLFEEKEEKWGYSFTSIFTILLLIFVTVINFYTIFLGLMIDRFIITLLMATIIIFILYTVLSVPSLEKNLTGQTIFFVTAFACTLAVIFSQFQLNIISIPASLQPFSDSLFILNLTLIFAVMSLVTGGEMLNPIHAIKHIYAIRGKKQQLPHYTRRELMYLGIIGIIISFLIAATLMIVDLPPVSPASLEWTYVIIFFAVFIIAVLVFLMINIFPDRKEGIIKEKIDKETIYSIALLSTSAIFGIVFLIVALLLQLEKISSLLGIGLTQKNALDFAIASILTMIGPYSFYGYARFKKIDKMEERFPEFLRDLSESRRAGMTMARAVEASAEGNYGKLTPEIKKMAIQISWGCSFTEALKLFADRLKTPLIKRSTSLVIKAQEAGGRVSDIIEAAARDCREIKILQDERKMEMKLYLIIVYIAFFVFLAVIVILADSFIPQLISSTQDVQGIGMIKSGGSVWEYQFIFICAAISQAIGNGLVGGVLGEGNIPAGLRHGFILVLISYIIFKVII